MKGRIWKDERYPDYGISPHDAPVQEIPDELFERWQKVNEDYDAIQKELQKFYEVRP